MNRMCYMLPISGQGKQKDGGYRGVHLWSKNYKGHQSPGKDLRWSP